MDACIGIGMSATDDRQPMRKPYPFTQISVPLLNSVGSEDYPALPRQAKALDALLDGMPRDQYKSVSRGQAIILTTRTTHWSRS